MYIHCIGHSLGAHACGFFGNAVSNDTDHPRKSRINRITALSPAGPTFTTKFGISKFFLSHLQEAIEAENLRDNERLEQSDALKVDVLHTDTDDYGTAMSIGHADFYIGNTLENLGSVQSGCSGSRGCDHSRAEELMRLSIQQKTQCWAHFTCGGPSNNTPGLPT